MASGPLSLRVRQRSGYAADFVLVPRRPEKQAYGPHRAQFLELSRPAGSATATIVVIHGGFWRARYTLSLGRPLARDLCARGYAVANLEYRRVGRGGGYPATLSDIAAGLDVLADLDVPAERVVTIGHSAGGHLAVWAAGRSLLPAGAPGATPRVAVTGAVSQAGVLSLVDAHRARLGAGAVRDFMGATPDADPARYAVADPMQLLPMAAPVLCVHGRRDDIVPLKQSMDYVDAAKSAGGRARVTVTDGDHFTLIKPGSSDWAAVVDALAALLG